MNNWLQPSYCIDSDHPDIQQMAHLLTERHTNFTEKAIALFYAVRDQWRYNPYRISFNKSRLKASHVAQRSEGHCIDKASLLIAMARAVGIPGKLCLVKVRNHIATEKFELLLGTNLLVPHGYASLYLQDRWVKLTPAFNKSLCDKIGVAPLEFDGSTDALFQEFDQKGSLFMEYLEDFGCFADVPVDYIERLMRQHYPQLFDGSMDTSVFIAES